MGECFICLEEGELFRTCDCNLQVHKACFEKMIYAQFQNKNELTCSVCKSRYDQNVKTRSNLLMFNTLMLVFSLVGLIQCTQTILTFVLSYNDSHQSNVLVLNICISAVFIVALVTLHIKYKEQTGSYRWCVLSQPIKSVEIKTNEINTCLTFPDHKCVSSNNMNVSVRIPCLTI